jgi:tetratricopeptide (TPR) repeat protein
MTRAALAVLLLAPAALAQPPGAGRPAVSAEQEKGVELFRAGKVDEALAALQAAARANPKLPPARVTLSSLYLQAQNGVAARQALEQAAAEDPKHPDVYLLNASYAFGEGRLTDTVLSCSTAITLSTDPRWDADQKKRFTREARLGLASAFEGRKDWALARDQVTAVLADDPKNAVIRQRLATCLFFLGNPDGALAELRTAHKDDPAAELPELRMYQLATSAGDPAKAEGWLKAAIAAHPQNPRTQRAYAGHLLDLGDPAAARGHLDAAVKLDPANLDTGLLRGLMARYTKDYPAAEKLYEDLLREYPADTRVAWNLSLVLAESQDAGKRRRAVELAENEVRKNNRQPEALAVYAWALYKVGRLDDAERAIGAATQLGVMTRDAAFFAGRVLADKGRPELAVQALRAAEQGRGAFVYRAEAAALLAELEKKLPKDAPKK